MTAQRCRHRRIAIHYGAADAVTGLAFCQVDELIGSIKENSEL